MNKWTLILAINLLLVFPLVGQHEHPLSQHTETTEHFKKYRIAVLIGHTFIPARHSSERLIIPSWGLDLEYWFNPTWGIGLHNDIELQSFLIERENDELIEREYPLVMTLDLLYKPWRGLVLQLGPGYELEAAENYFLLRIGAEYEFELPGHWDISPTFFYDTRDKVYDTWSLALGVGKRF